MVKAAVRDVLDEKAEKDRRAAMESERALGREKPTMVTAEQMKIKLS